MTWKLGSNCEKTKEGRMAPRLFQTWWIFISLYDLVSPRARARAPLSFWEWHLVDCILPALMINRRYRQVCRGCPRCETPILHDFTDDYWNFFGTTVKFVRIFHVPLFNMKPDLYSNFGVFCYIFPHTSPFIYIKWRLFKGTRTKRV